MKYKKIITNGCSFSDPITPFTWPNQLENYIHQTVDSSVKFDHRGLSSQGQELIQKKTLHAIHEALEEGYDPSEICVFVMWSSNDRKSFYVDNPDFIKEIVDNWKLSNQGWQLQLADLKNTLSDPDTITTSATGYNQVPYNKAGGWLITSAHVNDELTIFRDYFMMSLNANSISAVHLGLENVILLQTFCKLHGIKLYQQYFMKIPREDFEIWQTHQNAKYLYAQLDHSMFIAPKSSIHEYLLDSPACFVSFPSNPHPNGLGYRRWVMEVMLPHLEEDGFFE